MFARVEFIIFTLMLFNSIWVEAVQRMLGSRDALPEEFPFVGAIDYIAVSPTPFINVAVVRGFPMCTSSTVTPEWSLTAAHCVVELQKVMSHANPRFNIVPYIAYRSAGVPSMFSVKTDIIGATAHPAYRHDTVMENSFVHNDIGLLRTRPVRLRTFARLSALDYRTLIGNTVTVLGYGITNLSQNFVGQPIMLNKPLQVAKVLMITCPKVRIINAAICLSGPCDQLFSLCVGDSGGPLLHTSGVVGVSSMGTNVCSHDYRELHARMGLLMAATSVSAHIGWLSDRIKSNECDVKFVTQNQANSSTYS